MGNANQEKPRQPSVAMYEAPTELIVIAAIPGVPKADIDVVASLKAIRISGHRTGVPDVAEAECHYDELQRGFFERILKLPVPVDLNAISASHSDGLLKIRLPKPGKSSSFIELPL